MSTQLSSITKTLPLKIDGTSYNHAGTAATYTSEYVDLAGYSGARFIWLFGAGTNAYTVTCSLQGCATSGGSYVATTGASLVHTVATAAGVTGQISLIDIHRPAKRFYQAVTITSNTVVLKGLIVELYGVDGSVPEFTQSGVAVPMVPKNGTTDTAADSWTGMGCNVVVANV